MAYEFVTLKRDGKVVTVLLNRPPTNPLSSAFGRELYDAFAEVGRMEEVSVVVIASALEKAFVAGADIKEMAAMDRKASEEFSKLLQDANNLLARMKKVVIAAINGHALGGGCELALACDYRLMKKGKGRIGLPEATLGIVPGAGGTQRLPRLVGLSKALDILLRGRAMEPEEALSIGLVDRLIEPENFMDEVMAFARELASGAGKAMGAIKAAVREGLDLPMEEALAVERRHGLENLGTHDAKEGLLAFAEKRKPVFLGR
ncbi:MAG: enoyl-CoA hydratase-related protein [Deltaproteobacteria bacterium]